MTEESKIKRAATARRWRLANRDHLKQLKRKWYVENTSKWRLAHTTRAYKITPDEYEQRLASQNGLCALCGERFEGTGKTGRGPVLDHDHKTGKLRKFIHRECNSAIGKLKDSPSLLRKAAEYLESFECLR